MRKLLKQKQLMEEEEKLSLNTPTIAPTWNTTGDPISYVGGIGQTNFAYTDPTVAWSLTLPPPFYTGLPFYGVMRKTTVVVPDVAIDSVFGTDIALNMFIMIEGINSYYDISTGVQGTTVAVLTLQQAIYVPTATPTYTLVYRLASDVQFAIPLTLLTLNVQIGWASEQPIPWPQEGTWHFPMFLDLVTRPERKTLKMIREIKQMEFDF